MLEITEYFEEKGFDGSIENIVVNGIHVRLFLRSQKNQIVFFLIFVHGAPGSWDAFKDYLTDEDLKSKARVVAYDRPGYGGSGTDAMSGIQESI